MGIITNDHWIVNLARSGALNTSFLKVKGLKKPGFLLINLRRVVMGWLGNIFKRRTNRTIASLQYRVDSLEKRSGDILEEKLKILGIIPDHECLNSRYPLFGNGTIQGLRGQGYTLRGVFGDGNQVWVKDHKKNPEKKPKKKRRRPRRDRDDW